MTASDAEDARAEQLRECGPIPFRRTQVSNRAETITVHETA